MKKVVFSCLIVYQHECFLLSPEFYLTVFVASTYVILKLKKILDVALETRLIVLSLSCI